MEDTLLEDFRKALGKVEQPIADEYDTVKNVEKLAGDKPAKAVDDGAETGILGSGKVTSMELSDIAEKYGVDITLLRTAADAAESPIDDVTFGVPSWIYKKLQDAGGEKAIDEVRSLVESRRSGLESAARILAPGVGGKIAAATKGVKAGIAAGAAMGAVSGIAGSKSGEELESGAMGASMGGTLSGVFSPETIGKFTGLPVFKKIKAKFNRPDVAVDTLEGFKQIKNKLTEQIKKFDDIRSNWGFVKKEGAELTSQDKETLANYAGFIGKLRREAIDAAPKFPTNKLGSKERSEAIDLEMSKILGNKEHSLAKELEGYKEKLSSVGGFISPDRLDDLTATMDGLRRRMTKIADLKAKATKAQITEGATLSELGDFFMDQTLNAKTFMGKGGVGGFSAGTKYTTSLEEGMPTQMHEFSHRIVSEVAETLSGKTKMEAPELEAAIYDKMNSFIDLQTISRLTNYLADKGYSERELGKEIIPWMQNMLNDSKTRNEYRDWLRKFTTNKSMEVDEKLGVDNFMADWNALKKASKKITKWAGAVTEDGLAGELAGTTKKLGNEAGDIIDVAAMKSGIRNIKPIQKELDALSLESHLADIPGLKLIDNGLGVDVIVEGKKIGGFNDVRHAVTRALEWKRDNPDKLEKLIIKAEPVGRGTYIPPEKGD